MDKDLRSVGRRTTWDWLAYAVLLLAILIGGTLRLYDLNWDQGALYHPDERWITMVTTGMSMPTSIGEFLDPAQSPLNPYYGHDTVTKQVVERVTNPATEMTVAEAQKYIPQAVPGMVVPVEVATPRTFAYGTLPVYVTRAVSTVMAKFDPVWTDYDHTPLVGRAISGLLDTAAILLVFLIGQRFWGKRAGALGALFYALTVLSIQHSHFYTTDITVNFFILLTVFFATSLARSGDWRSGFLAGGAAGMALASKFSAAPVLLLIPLALLIYRLGWGRDAAEQDRRRTISVAAVLASVIGFLLLLFIFQPYTFLDPNGLIKSINEQNQILVSGQVDVPYTRQYINTTPYIYFLDQTVRWAMGLPLGLTALGGWLLLLVLAVRKRSTGAILLLAWMLPYFLITGRFHAKFLRYMLPLLPFLALAAAVLLVEMRGWFARLDSRLRMRPGGIQPVVSAGVRAITPVVTACVLIVTVFWAFAFMHIYTQPHTANEAAQWINANVPDGSSITSEHWEEGLRGLKPSLHLPDATLPDLELYNDDNQTKLIQLEQALTQSDYIVFYSNRLYGTIPRLTERYPMSQEYYKLLFSGKLGYQLVHFSANYPELAGIAITNDTFSRPGLPVPAPLASYKPAPITINGGFADESFTVYDHPLVLVFKKTRPITAAEIDADLRPYLPTPGAAQDERQALETDQQRALNEVGGTFTQLFDPQSLANRLPVLYWFLMIEVLSLVALPLTLFICRPLADRGYIFARLVGLLLLAWLVWMPVSLGWLQNTRATAFGALIALIVVGLISWWRSGNAINRWLNEHWKTVVLQEGIFWVAFLAFMGLRMANPDLWHLYKGGEKPMDFAFLMATIKSTTLPPYDPWFAGGYINYYYYGQYMLSLMIKITGILPEIAYNLAIPFLFALSLTGAWSLGFNLLSRLRLGTRWTIFGASMTAALLAVLGNLDGGVQLFNRLVTIGGPAPAANVTLSPLEMWGRFLVGLGKAITEGQQALQIPTDWYWAPTRVYPPTAYIQEFPFFTFMYADLHAHMIALPVTLLVLTLALTWLLRGGDKVESLKLKVEGWSGLAKTGLLIGVTALALGALWPMNSWDYPTYTVVLGGALMLGWWRRFQRRLSEPREKRASWTSFWIWDLGISTVGLGLLIVGLGYLLYLPFHQSFVQGYTGFEQHDERTPFALFLLVHGLFLYITLAWGITSLWQWLAGTGGGRSLAMLGRRPSRLHRITRLSSKLVKRSDWRSLVALYGTLAMLVVIAVTGVLGYGAVVAFSLVCALIFIGLALTERPAVERFAMAAIALGLILAAAVEICALKGDIGRMNTVFKFYFQVWTLFSLAAGMGATIMVRKIVSARVPGWEMPVMRPAASLGIVAEQPAVPVRTRESRERGWTFPMTFAVALGRVWLFFAILFLLVAAMYPLIAARGKAVERFDNTIPPTLNGMAYMERAGFTDEMEVNGQKLHADIQLRDDLAAILWMRQNIPGSPVILEAAVGRDPNPHLYTWGSRVAIYTGLPTVLGWDNHERQQRSFSATVDQREDDVVRMYTMPDLDATMQLLQQYRVRYIYYGPLERFHYPEGAAKLSEMAARGMISPVYNLENVTIYKVNGQTGD